MKLRVFFFPILLFLQLALWAQVPSYVPANGLRGWWPFSGNANDLSTYSNNGSVTGAALVNDRFGSSNSAYSFNGVSDFISTSYNGVLGTGARAVSFWAKSTYSFGGPGMTAVAWGANSSGNRFNCMFNYVASGPTFDSGDGAITYASSTNIYDNNWHHFVYQISNLSNVSQAKIYVDGVLLTQVLHTYNINNVFNTTSNFNVHFGRIIYSAGNLFFNGQLDDIGIWERELTMCEINQLYTSSLPPISASSSNTLICKGQTATLTASGGATYQWNTSATSSTIVVSPTVATNYTVTGTTATGCPRTVTISLNVNDVPALNISGKNAICVGESVKLTASGASSYTWSNASNSPTTIVSPTTTISYTVSGTANSCTNNAVVTVTVNKCTELTNNGEMDGLLVFPNPTNEKFFIRVKEDGSEIQIYNNTGALIFKTLAENKQTEIDLTNFPKGVYFVKITGKQGFDIKKVIKE